MPRSYDPDVVELRENVESDLLGAAWEGLEEAGFKVSKRGPSHSPYLEITHPEYGSVHQLQLACRILPKPEGVL